VRAERDAQAVDRRDRDMFVGVFLRDSRVVDGRFVDTKSMPPVPLDRGRSQLLVALTESPTSTGTAVAVPLFSRISPATRSACSLLKSATTTAAPSAAKALGVSLDAPEPGP
jgi:hypothetical protein